MQNNSAPGCQEQEQKSGSNQLKLSFPFLTGFLQFLILK